MAEIAGTLEANADDDRGGSGWADGEVDHGYLPIYWGGTGVDEGQNGIKSIVAIISGGIIC